MGVQIGGDWLLRDRDKEWVKIRDLCEESQGYDTLDALQALNDNTFDILEGLHQARESLLITLAPYEDMAFNASNFYAQEQDAVSSIIEDIELRIEHVTREYFKNLDNLMK
ncbi:hypothetical protein [Vulcanococcus limneticus]|uniref:hypothetical protein n=1 Tax=Vulcanococcus limneticus TaxID=2170428 RepID=UPI00398C2355